MNTISLWKLCIALYKFTYIESHINYLLLTIQNKEPQHFTDAVAKKSSTKESQQQHFGIGKIS